MTRIIAFGLTLFLINGAAAFGQSELKGYETFQNMKLLVPMGDKLTATNVSLRFEPDRIVVRSLKENVNVKVLPYSAIRSAEYSYSKGPRYQATVPTAILANVFSIPLFVTKVEKHRLVVHLDRDYALLDLDRNNYRAVLTAFETNTRKKIAIAPTQVGVQQSGLMPAR